MSGSGKRNLFADWPSSSLRPRKSHNSLLRYLEYTKNYHPNRSLSSHCRVTDWQLWLLGRNFVKDGAIRWSCAQPSGCSHHNLRVRLYILRAKGIHETSLYVVGCWRLVYDRGAGMFNKTSDIAYLPGITTDAFAAFLHRFVDSMYCLCFC